MNKICECCGSEYTPVGKKPGSILWDRRKFCSRSCSQTRHGLAKTFEYRVWNGVLSRCNTPSATGFADYGGRGIKVCDRWRSFPAFLEDMGFAPSPAHTVERRDVDGDYEPSNCFWLPKTSQARNTRRTLMIEFKGQSKPLVTWCEELGLNYYTTHSRIGKLGWTVERALTEAVQPANARSPSSAHEGPATIAYAP